MDIICKYFPDLSPVQKTKLRNLGSLYADWNQKINLISRKDMPLVYERHILHSMSISLFFTFPDNSKIIDIGTGGGLPGIPTAILFPNANFTLVDSIGKKIKVVNDIIEKLELKNCQAKQARAEQLDEKYDFIISRAVTNFSDFVKNFKKIINTEPSKNLQKGIIYLKGGDFEDEIKKYRQHIELFNLSEKFNEDFFITKKLIFLKYPTPIK